MEDHYSPIWYSQCTWQYQHQGTLYVGPCACRANARSQLHIAVVLTVSLNPHKNGSWPGHASATPKRVDLGCPGPPRPGGMAQTEARTGQGAAAQMGTPICLQQPGPG